MATRLLGLRVRTPPGALMSISSECCVLSGRGLCDEPIPRPSVNVCVCVCVCVRASLNAIRCNNIPLHLQRLGRRGQTKKERRKSSVHKSLVPSVEYRHNYCLQPPFLNFSPFLEHLKKVKGKAVPLQAWSGPEGSRK